MGKSLGSVTCPLCKKRTKKITCYVAECECGCYLDLDGRTGEIRHYYQPEVVDQAPKSPKAPKAPKSPKAPKAPKGKKDK